MANNGPAGHYSQQVADNVVFAAVPECISKLRIILQGITGKRKMKTLFPPQTTTVCLKYKVDAFKPQARLVPVTCKPGGNHSKWPVATVTMLFISSSDTASHHPDKKQTPNHFQVEQPDTSSYLDCNRIDCPSYFKAALLEHHHRCIVYTGACPENKVSISQSLAHFSSNRKEEQRQALMGKLSTSPRLLFFLLL